MCLAFFAFDLLLCFSSFVHLRLPRSRFLTSHDEFPTYLLVNNFSHCLEHVSSNNSTMDNAKLSVSEIINKVKQLNKHDQLTLLKRITDELLAADDEVIDPPEDEVSQSTPTVNNTNTGLLNYFTTRTTDSLEFNSAFPTTNEQTTSEVREVFTNSATTTPHHSPFSVTSTTNVRTNSSTSEETVIKTSPWTPETKLNATSTKRVLPTKATAQLQKGQNTTSQNEISKEKQLLKITQVQPQ
ncbi:mucin-5AC-like [Montipora capricornis]|uniref:mucin-5AC-like n=1 Tax=Montipora capricornis TaxID=246305 RepID=UPI0035F1DFA5